MKVVREHIEFERGIEPSHAMGIGQFYYFYQSQPILNKLIDFKNENHLNLIKWMIENKTTSPMPTHKFLNRAQISKARRLSKKVGFEDMYVSEIFGLDIMFRFGSHADYETAGLHGRYYWVSLDKIAEIINPSVIPSNS